MKKGIIAIYLVSLLCKQAYPQTTPGYNRSMLSVMIVPVPGKNDNQVKDEDFAMAVSSINNALIEMGYSRTMDSRTYARNNERKHNMTPDARTDSREMDIEQAPVDMQIETEIIWINPPGNPRNRQVKLRLKAIDNYTSAVYADNGFIQSSQREFQSLRDAVESALARDGKAQFKSFLDQLDSSYVNLVRNGRQLNIQFAVDRESTCKFSDRAANGSLADTIIGIMRQKAFLGQLSVTGETPTHMELNVFIPLTDRSGIHVVPSWYIRKDMSEYFNGLGYSIDYAVNKMWMSFTLIKNK